MDNSRGTVAQLVECLSKVLVWCNSTAVGLNLERVMSSNLSDLAAAPRHEVQGKNPLCALCYR